MLLLSLIVIICQLGSIKTDSDLKEFCSKGYFDGIVDRLENNNRYFDIYRNSLTESGINSTHLWKFTVEEQSDTGHFNLSLKSHEMTGKVVSVAILNQPNDCPIPIEPKVSAQVTNFTKKSNKSLKWDLNGFKLNTPTTSPWFDFNVTNWIINQKDKTIKDEIQETVPKPTAQSAVTSILCLKSNKKIYVIEEDMSSIGSQNRRQFVSSLDIIVDTKENNSNADTIFVETKLEFKFNRIGKTIFEFLGFGCSVDFDGNVSSSSDGSLIDGSSTDGPLTDSSSTDGSPTVSSSSFVVYIFVVGFVLAVIVIIGLVIWFCWQPNTKQSEPAIAKTKTKTKPKSVVDTAVTIRSKTV